MSARRQIDELLAARLATGATLKAAAAELGIGEATARRRWADPAFRAAVASLKTELRDSIVGNVLHRTSAALERLGRLLDDPNPLVQLKAAVAIVDAYRVMASTPEPASPAVDVSAVTEWIARSLVTQESGNDVAAWTK